MRVKADEEEHQRNPMPENVEAVIGLVNARPSISLSEIKDESGISPATAHRILKDSKYKSYKIKCHQDILERDYEPRAEFCQSMMERANNDRNFLHNVCFTDEATFTLHNKPNTQNCRQWAQENPHNLVATRTQYPQKVNVWAGIFRHHIIGPFFIDGNLNAEKYLETLNQLVIPRLRQIEPDLENNVWFQQDGCPAHNTQEIMALLRNNFRGTICRAGTLRWPPRSPDLAPCDFFLWGHLKSAIYKTRHYNLEDLREAIIQGCRQITNRQLANVRREFYNRLGYCLAQNGGHFEHLI